MICPYEVLIHLYLNIPSETRLEPFGPESFDPAKQEPECMPIDLACCQKDWWVFNALVHGSAFGIDKTREISIIYIFLKTWHEKC